MPTLNLGRVGFVNKGTWLISTAYKINDTVTYLGGTYACLIANTGQTPILGGTIYWQEWVANDVVHKSGAETITDVKTFTSSPIVPDATLSGQATNKGQLDLKAPLASPSLTGTVSINGANVTAYGKNYLINGGFDYWNYATSQTTSGYGSDNRWDNVNIGSTKTHSQQLSTDTERALFNSLYFSRTVVTSVVGPANTVRKWQTIENIAKLAGKTVTISFWAKADTSKNIAIELFESFGTGGTPSVSVLGISPQLVPLTTIWQKKTITVTLPSIIGKTIGTDGVHTSYTALCFWFDAGTDYSSRTANLGQQSGTFDIAEVKLEEGSVATPWTPYEGEFGGEVQACQRYLPSYISKGTASPISMGQAESTTLVEAFINFPVKTRVPPTGFVLSNTTHLSTTGSATVGSGTASINIVSDTIVGLRFTTGSLTTNGALAVYFNNASAYLYFTGCEL